MANRSTRIGGGNRIDFFALTSSGGKVTFGTLLLTVDQITSTAWSGSEITKDLKLDLTHDKDNAAVRSLLADYLPPQGSGSSTKYEDSSLSSVNSGNYDLLVGYNSYGGVDSDGKRLIKSGLLQVTGGDEKWEADKPNMIKLGGVAVLNEYPVVIGTSSFSTYHIATPALTTIAAGGYGSTYLMTKQN